MFVGIIGSGVLRSSSGGSAPSGTVLVVEVAHLGDGDMLFTFSDSVAPSAAPEFPQGIEISADGLEFSWVPLTWGYESAGSLYCWSDSPPPTVGYWRVVNDPILAFDGGGTLVVPQSGTVV